jgi:AraC-like DNA-binding protein
MDEILSARIICLLVGVHMNIEARNRNREHNPMALTAEDNSKKVAEMTIPSIHNSSNPYFGKMAEANIPTNSSIDERIAFVLEMMLSSSNRSVPIKPVAAMLNLSPSRLRHLFKEQVGVPIHRYEVMLRLENVRLLLSTTACGVKEAAHIMGFRDLSNFTNTFKRKYGLTPGKVKLAHFSISDRENK